MRTLAIVLIFSIAAFVALADKAKDGEEEAKWIEFKKMHGKKYNNAEEGKRKGIFLKNERKIQAHNKGNRGWKMSHNHLSDKTDDEKKSLLGAVAPRTHAPRHGLEQFQMDRSDMEMMERQSTLDYRTDSCLGPVKDQSWCGSCWAFSAIASLEFASCKKRNDNYVALSEQQMVDCDGNNYGCQGGWPYSTWGYVSTAGGSEASSTYPYTAEGGTCLFCSLKAVAKVASRGYVQANNITAIEAALIKYGPLSVAIEVQESFYSYYSGVYDDVTCPTDGTVNHAVNVVGYGADYWIVRNSWGSYWGDNGYILMKKGVNMCSIESWVTYVEAL